MPVTRTQNWQLIQTGAVPVIGKPANSSDEVIIAAIDRHLDFPLRLFASATPDANLNIAAATIAVGDGTSKVPPIQENSVASSFVATTINFQTGVVTGGTVKVQTATFALPTSTAGKFRRFALVYRFDGVVDTAFSAEADTQNALADAGTIFAVLDGLPLGYVDLVATDTNAFKTAGGAENKVYNAGIFRFGSGAGVGGSGTGDVSELRTMLDNQFSSSPFNYMSPVIYKVDKSGHIDVSSTGSYSFLDKAFAFSDAAQTLITSQLADLFLAEGRDVSSVDLMVYWKSGKVDTAAEYYVSRDGGNNYQEVSMTRLGSSLGYYGTLDLTTEASFASLVDQSAGASLADLDATNYQKIGQSTVLANTKVVTQVVINPTVSGTPEGIMWVALCADSAGLPGTVLAESSAQSIASMTTGALAVDVPATVLVAGTYHAVVRTDDAYKNHYTATSGAHKLQLAYDSAADGMSKNNGSAFSDDGTKGLKWTLKGRTLDLRVKIVSSAGSVAVDGFGIFYDKVTPGLSGVQKKVFVTSFQSDAQPAYITLPWIPDSDIMFCNWVQEGRMYMHDAFDLDGKKVIFPSGFFSTGDVIRTVKLKFVQLEGSVDNTDSSAALLVANGLGSTDASISKAAIGAGPNIMNANGVLRKLVLDADDNIVVQATA